MSGPGNAHSALNVTGAIGQPHCRISNTEAQSSRRYRLFVCISVSSVPLCFLTYIPFCRSIRQRLTADVFAVRSDSQLLQFPQQRRVVVDVIRDVPVWCAVVSVDGTDFEAQVGLLA